MEEKKRIYNNPLAAPEPVRDNTKRLWSIITQGYDAIDTVGATTSAIRNCETALLAAQRWALDHSEEGRIKPECNGPGMLDLLNSIDLEIAALHLLIDIYTRRKALLAANAAAESKTRGTDND